MPTRKTPYTSGPVRYACYARCSTDDQAQKDFSTIDTQRDLNAEYVRTKGGTVASEYADEGKSGTNLNRPDWKRLLADAQKGLFDAVCVTYMSRLGRGNAFIIAEYELQKCGVRVEMVREQFTDDLAGYMGKTMTNMMDGVYSKMVSGWTTTKMQEMFERGYVCGHVPFGYVKEPAPGMQATRGSDGKLKEPPSVAVPCPVHADTVRQAFALYVEVGTVARVRDFLRQATGRAWTTTQTTNLLADERYTGVALFGQWRKEDAHPALVDRDTWQVAQALQRTRTRQYKENPTDDYSFYLRGAVHCAHCQKRMTPANHYGRAGKSRYYECYNCSKRTTACPVARVNADSLHVAILEHIKRVAQSTTRTSEVIKEAVKALPTPEKMGTEGAALTRRLRDVEKPIQGVLAAIETGSAPRSLVNRLQELESERAEVLEQQRQLDAKVAETAIQRPDVETVQGWFKNFVRLWDMATEEERMTLLPLIVDRVELREKERGFCRLRFTAQNPRLLRTATSKNVVIKF